MAKPVQESVPPKDMANVAPVDMGGVAGQTRIIVDAVKETVSELKADVKEIKNYRHSDFLWHLGLVGSAFFLLSGILATVYFKIEDKMHALSIASTRVETKLEDLLRRIPPMPTPVPKR